MQPCRGPFGGVETGLEANGSRLGAARARARPGGGGHRSLPGPSGDSLQPSLAASRDGRELIGGKASRQPLDFGLRGGLGLLGVRKRLG